MDSAYYKSHIVISINCIILMNEKKARHSAVYYGIIIFMEKELLRSFKEVDLNVVLEPYQALVRLQEVDKISYI